MFRGLGFRVGKKRNVPGTNPWFGAVATCFLSWHGQGKTAIIRVD